MVLAATSIVQVAVFVLGAVIVLGGAVGVVGSRNPVHSALSLVVTLFGIAVLFVEQRADFLAVVQVIVYAGAIVVLFLFVIMLLGVDRHDVLEAEDELRGQRPAALAVGVIGLGALLVLTRVTNWSTGARSTAGPLTTTFSNVETLGRAIFTRYLLPFEITSALLVIAVVGAVALARRPGTPEGEAAARAERSSDQVSTP